MAKKVNLLCEIHARTEASLSISRKESLKHLFSCAGAILKAVPNPSPTQAGIGMAKKVGFGLRIRARTEAIINVAKGKFEASFQCAVATLKPIPVSSPTQARPCNWNDKKANSVCEFARTEASSSMSLKESLKHLFSCAGAILAAVTLPGLHRFGLGIEIAQTAPLRMRWNSLLCLRRPEILRGRRKGTNYLDSGTHYRVLLIKFICT